MGTITFSYKDESKDGIEIVYSFKEEGGIKIIPSRMAAFLRALGFTESTIQSIFNDAADIDWECL